MELNINSPAYFAEHYGVDDEVYRFCQRVYLYFKDKAYSDTLHIIGITPVAAPQELYENGAWKERIQLVSDKSCAIITIRMNFEDYYKADSDGRIEQTRAMLLAAVKKVSSRGNFDYNKFKEDFSKI